jgi:outer membrane protein assembly factor BamA
MSFSWHFNLHFFIILLLLLASNNSVCQDFKLQIKSNDSILLNHIEKYVPQKKYNSLEAPFKKIDSISFHLKKIGYINHEVSTKQVDSTLTVTFTKFSKIDFAHLRYESSALLRDFFEKKKIKDTTTLLKIPFEETPSLLEEISNYLNDKGYAFSNTRLENIQQKENLLFADLMIDIGERILIDDIVIKGYDEFPKKKLRKLLNLKNKSVFNKSFIGLLNDQLSNIPFLEATRKPEVLFANDATRLYIYLKKQPQSKFDGLMAFSTKENGELILNGDLNLALNNVFNKAEELKFEWQSSETRKNLSIDGVFPYLFNSNFIVASNFGIQRTDTSFVNVNLQSKVGYQLSKFKVLNLIGAIENSNTSNNIDTSNVLDYQKMQLGLNYSLSKRIENHLPSKIKTQLSAELQVGRRKSNEQNENQQLFQLQFKYLLTLNHRNHIWLRSSNRFLKTNNTLQNELFAIGGFNSIRGFREQEILTSKYSVNNIEYHFVTGEKSYFYGLIDSGVYYEEAENTYETPYAIGFGYALANKQSMLNFSYAIARKNNQHFDLNNAKFHLKVAYLF